MALATSVNTSRPRAAGFDLAITETGSSTAYYYPLAAGPGRGVRQVAAQGQGDGPSTAENPEDFDAETGTTFSRFDFSGGEGLDYAHQRSNRDPGGNRFWDSRDLDVRFGRPGEPAHVRAALAVEDLGGVYSNANGAYLAYDVEGDDLYWSDGSNSAINSIVAPISAAPAFGLIPFSPVGGATPVDVAAYDGLVYVADGTDLWRSDDTATAWSTENVRRVWVVKGRVVVATGAASPLVLKELAITASGTPAAAARTLKTLTTATWTDVCDAGHAILASAKDGFVYAFADDGGVLTLEAQSEFPGEKVHAVASSQGVVLVSTSDGDIGRIWLCRLGENYTLTREALLKEAKQSGANNAYYARAIKATRDYFFFCLADHGNTTAYGGQSLWRYDIAAGGLIRLNKMASNNHVGDLEIIGNRVFISQNGVNILRQAAATYVSSGELIGPLADFYSSQDKAWVSARLVTDDTTASNTVALLHGTDPDLLTTTAGWTASTTNAATSSDDEIPITQAIARHLAGRVVFTIGTTSATPRLFGYSFRASAGVVYEVPVNIGDQQERPGRRAHRVKGLGERRWDRLRTHEGKQVTLADLRTNDSYQGVIESVGRDDQLRPSRGSVGHVALVRFRGVRV